MQRHITIQDRHGNTFEEWHDHKVPFYISATNKKNITVASRYTKSLTVAARTAQTFYRRLDQPTVTIVDATGNHWYIHPKP